MQKVKEISKQETYDGYTRDELVKLLEETDEGEEISIEEVNKNFQGYFNEWKESGKIPKNYFKERN